MTVTTYQHGAPDADIEAPLEAAHQSTRVSTGAIRFANGEVVSAGTVRYQAGAEAPAQQGSVLATRRQEGPHDTCELVPGVAASRTDIRTALREGLIRETSPGFYEDVSPVQAPAGDPQDPPEPLKGPEQVFDQKEAAIWAGAIEPIDQGVYDNTVACAIASIATDGDLDSVARVLAQSGQVEPDEAQELVDTGVEWYRGTLTRDLVKQGLCTPKNVEAFYDYARSSPRLTEAMLEMAHQGRTDTFRQMAREYSQRQKA